MKEIRFFLALITTSIRASLSLKVAFLIEFVLMIGNNLVFLVLWWLFFEEFKSIGGWTFHDMLTMMAIVSGGYGMSKVFFGGVKEIAYSVVTGKLDHFLTQPKNVLIHILSVKSQSKGWGNMMTSLILVGIGGVSLILKLPMLLFFMVCACLVFTSAGVMAHSLAFWLGSIELVSDKYCDSLYLFTHYPVNIYSGGIQIIMYTFFPAGVIAFIPVELLKKFSQMQFGIFVLGVTLFVSIAFLVFHKGLKRYESGNLAVNEGLT